MQPDQGNRRAWRPSRSKSALISLPSDERSNGTGNIPADPQRSTLFAAIEDAGIVV
jgi:hypothetical protein